MGGARGFELSPTLYPETLKAESGLLDGGGGRSIKGRMSWKCPQMRDYKEALAEISRHWQEFVEASESRLRSPGRRDKCSEEGIGKRDKRRWVEIRHQAGEKDALGRWWGWGVQEKAEPRGTSILGLWMAKAGRSRDSRSKEQGLEKAGRLEGAWRQRAARKATG